MTDLSKEQIAVLRRLPSQEIWIKYDDLHKLIATGLAEFSRTVPGLVVPTAAGRKIRSHVGTKVA